jgi:hypothetical protein
VCPNSSSSFRPFTTILWRPSSCTLHPTHAIPRLFFLALPSSLTLVFQKNQYRLTAYFFYGTFLCVCMFLCFDCCCSYSLLVPITIYMYVRMYEKKNERRNIMMKDEGKKEIENSTFIMIMVIIIIITFD